MGLSAAVVPRQEGVADGPAERRKRDRIDAVSQQNPPALVGGFGQPHDVTSGLPPPLTTVGRSPGTGWRGGIVAIIHLRWVGTAMESDRPAVEFLIEAVGSRPIYLGPDAHAVADSVAALWFTLALGRQRGPHLAFRVLS